MFTSSSSCCDFLGRPRGFLPGVTAAFLPFGVALFLLPFGRPRGLLGVGASLGSCGFFLGRPRPLFSDTSFSPLEARGWLDLALDSLMVSQLDLGAGCLGWVFGGGLVFFGIFFFVLACLCCEEN